MKLSIIIPVYNQEDLVVRALGSIPEREDVEVIVIDDGSTDNTWNALQRFAAFPHWFSLKILKNDKNRGVGYTKNVGLNHATGQYIVELDSDDYFYTDELLRALDQLDGTDLVFFNLRINDGTVFKLNARNRRGYCGSTKFLRRDFVGDTRYPEIEAGEDWHFFNKILEKTPTEKYTGIILKHYNFPREGSLSWRIRQGEIKVE